MYQRVTQDLPRAPSVRKEGEARCCVPPRRSRGFRASGDPQKGLQVCRCGNRSEPGSDLGTGLQHEAGGGRRATKFCTGGLAAAGSLRLASLCSTSGKIPCHLATVPQTATLPSNGVCLLVPLTKTYLFQRLFFHLRKAGTDAPSQASAEARC